MRTIWKLFTGDVRRITSNIISIIILIGLVVIPALFTWFNVTASWDPFGNTKNLKFAVASVDEGYTSDLMPVKTKLGDQVIGQLRANSQLDWTFTTKDKAIEGTKNGTYYAAVIIPKDFSRNMMTFFSNDAKHATLEYYTNEKKNAVAPKVTGQGADKISKEVNETFARTITSTALSVASGLSKQLDSSNSRDRLTSFNGNINDLANQLSEASTNVETYGSLIDVSETLLDSSSALLGNASKAADQSKKDLKNAGGSLKNVSSSLNTAMSTLSTSLKASSASNGSIAADIDNAFNSAGKSSADASSSLRSQANAVGNQATQYQKIRDLLATLPGIPSETLNTIDSIITRQQKLQSALNTAANDLDTKTGDAQKQHDQIVSLANQSKTSIDGLNTDLNNTLKPQITSIASSLSSISGALTTGTNDLNSSLSTLNDTSKNANDKLKLARQTLSDTATTLSQASSRLSAFSEQLTTALNSNDMDKVKELLSSNPDTLADTLAAPVKLQRNAVFPVESFGASLTPFYTFIPLWVSSLLIALTIKTDVSRKTRRELSMASTDRQQPRRSVVRKISPSAPAAEAAMSANVSDETGEIDNDLADTLPLPPITTDMQSDTVDETERFIDEPKPYQLFLGRFGIFALISLLQSTFSCAGTLLFLRVHAVHPMLFMLTGWVSGLVYAFVIYTLVACFGTIGKAVSVIILVMQISGSSGTYPLQVLPKFVQVINPFLPASHSIQAARAAIAGIYQGDFWIHLGIVVLYAVIMLVIGLILPKPSKFNEWFSNQLSRTKLI
ncbi:putative membrane protein [Bifidobacterium commune]|uniref:YhgE/Pip N-terminal domain-containing protein/YhgE/Pip C-terminal domain-containing protein n=1 Tax=Bifidobacterium commune TaxID=1505727 RepID=A0A1C4H678_9BIFI|nr:YhgE/Pip domain-containing protein [Bifidobacterium commune]MBB2955394.1 putative membrane protein [Bifidobacterium commune]SCC80160.1 YhgE/Pip N-terminal domain-containing protein/YhgE/Pip C-terminal domain-containing protein [Bifidobacterium commune]